MNESQASKLAEIYRSMGYDANYKHTGGGVWLVTVFHPSDGSMTVFGADTVTKRTMRTDVNSQTIYLA